MLRLFIGTVLMPQKEPLHMLMLWLTVQLLLEYYKNTISIYLHQNFMFNSICYLLVYLKQFALRNCWKISQIITKEKQHQFYFSVYVHKSCLRALEF